MLLVKAAGERFVVACETADAVPDGALDAIRGVAGRAFVAGWTQTGSSANFGWAATAFESRKQKAESRNAARRITPTAANMEDGRWKTGRGRETPGGTLNLEP